MIAIQFITVHWSKKSRGAPESAKRNAVAEAFSLPATSIFDDKGIYLHQVKIFESQGFQEPDESINNPINDTTLRDINLELLNVDDKLVIYYWGDLKRPSYPNRKQVFTLTAGLSGRIISNGRFSSESTWYYQKHVYNIYYGRDKLANSLFNQRQPDFIFNDEVRLY